MKRKVLFLAACVGLCLIVMFSASCERLKARDHLNKGVQAFKNAQYPEAVEHFKISVDLDPTFPTARLYLATAYMMQYIPGADSPENNRMAKAAEDQFLEVLRQDPSNSVAIASIASLKLNQKQFDEAANWYKKQIAVDPKNKEAYYSLGFIAWSKWYPALMTARAKLGMKQEDPGPIKDKKVVAKLQEEYSQVIDEGIKGLEKALEIDKEYDDAMAYMNLLVRERADLAPDAETYKKEIEVADNWVQKALETKKVKAARMPAGAGGITNEQPAQQ
ncbi:MAG: tetratricopeptide repeat protein [Bryobacteraceae bacterium]